MQNYLKLPNGNSFSKLYTDQNIFFLIWILKQTGFDIYSSREILEAPFTILNLKNPYAGVYREFIQKNYRKHGIYRMWYRNENNKIILMEKKTFKNDELHGTSYTYREDNGRIWIEDNWMNGKLNGTKSSCFYDGRPMYIYNYQNGKKYGLCRYWTHAGQLISETNWKNDKKHGVCRSWSKYGKFIAESHWVDGHRDSTKTITNRKRGVSPPP